MPETMIAMRSPPESVTAAKEVERAAVTAAATATGAVRRLIPALGTLAVVCGGPPAHTGTMRRMSKVA
jgi:hypothetical protein